MHRFSRMHLSPEVALRNLDTIDLEEKNKLAEGIALIAVIDHRRDYLAAGYPSMFSYCTGRLHMSEDRAVRRIDVARVTLKFPEVLEYLADGRLSVTTACVLAPHLTPETVAGLLEASAFRSRQEIVHLLAERSRPATDETLALDGPIHVEDSSNLSAPVRIDSLAGSCAASGSESSAKPTPPAQAIARRRGRISPSANGGYDVRLSITDEEHDVLRQATALLGHSVPSGDPALVIARALKHYLAHLEKQRLGKKPGAEVAGNGRGTPKPLRRLVWERDGARCAFVSADGHRCEATRQLEVDHITLIAQGGATTADNLRLLCRPHNQFEAERVLGKEHVQRNRDTARSERAKTKAAAKASKARMQVRDEALQARHDDLFEALRGLGYEVARARRGAALVDTMPDAPLETCMRAALTHLARPLILRGERLARCSA